VYAHIALLCQTEARASPSKASLRRAQQCLQEWDRLAAAGLVGQADGDTGGAGDTQLVRQAGVKGLGWLLRCCGCVLISKTVCCACVSRLRDCGIYSRLLTLS
jgi:hypothetical protein